MSYPRVVLLHWNRGRWSASERREQAATENSCESWVFALDGDFLNTDLATATAIEGYDIVIANADYIHLEKLRSLAESRPSTCKWVTLIEGDAHDFARPRPHVRELFDASDLINCINRYTVDFLQSMTKTPVRFIGFPYPAEEMRKRSVPFEQRRREIFLAPMLLGRWSEFHAARSLGYPMFGYERKISRTWRNLAKNVRTHRSLDRDLYTKRAGSLYNDPNLTVRREVPLSDFFEQTAGSYVWLNLDPRYTWGRYILDAAALRIPIVTTRSTGQAEEFFPALTVEHEFATEHAQSLIRRLFDDDAFYRECADVPLEAFEHLRPEVKARQMIDALTPP
ncbi:MAG: hypothetical protein JSS75_01495 [Bacteroidetes bacterium]|nr:hypothetical protein [Bacteroidota bacterium]